MRHNAGGNCGCTVILVKEPGRERRETTDPDLRRESTSQASLFEPPPLKVPIEPYLRVCKGAFCMLDDDTNSRGGPWAHSSRIQSLKVIKIDRL
jgi:hypothetical protein